MSCCALEVPEMSAAEASTLLLATDFDGTIAPIVNRPRDAVMHDCARRLLERCAQARSIAVAILSGRDIEDVRGRLHGIRAIVAGSHGLECADAHGGMLWSSPVVFPQPDPAMVDSLTAAGLFVEKKKFAMALHFRERPDREYQVPLHDFIAWAQRNDLQVIAGRKVVEARVRGGGKREALQRIATLVRAKRVVYAGDDTTDVDALAYAAECGRAVFVASNERQPPEIGSMRIVQSVEGVCFAFIREIIDFSPDTALVLHGPDGEAPNLFAR